MSTTAAAAFTYNSNNARNSTNSYRGAKVGELFERCQSQDAALKMLPVATDNTTSIAITNHYKETDSGRLIVVIAF